MSQKQRYDNEFKALAENEDGVLRVKVGETAKNLKDIINEVRKNETTRNDVINQTGFIPVTPYWESKDEDKTEGKTGYYKGWNNLVNFADKIEAKLQGIDHNPNVIVRMNLLSVLIDDIDIMLAEIKNADESVFASKIQENKLITYINRLEKILMDTDLSMAKTQSQTKTESKKAMVGEAIAASINGMPHLFSKVSPKAEYKDLIPNITKAVAKANNPTDIQNIKKVQTKIFEDILKQLNLKRDELNRVLKKKDVRDAHISSYAPFIIDFIYLYDPSADFQVNQELTGFRENASENKINQKFFKRGDKVESCGSDGAGGAECFNTANPKSLSQYILEGDDFILKGGFNAFKILRKSYRFQIPKINIYSMVGGELQDTARTDANERIRETNEKIQKKGEKLTQINSTLVAAKIKEDSFLNVNLDPEAENVVFAMVNYPLLYFYSKAINDLLGKKNAQGEYEINIDPNNFEKSEAEAVQELQDKANEYIPRLELVLNLINQIKQMIPDFQYHPDWVIDIYQMFQYYKYHGISPAEIKTLLEAMSKEYQTKLTEEDSAFNNVIKNGVDKLIETGEDSDEVKQFMRKAKEMRDQLLVERTKMIEENSDLQKYSDSVESFVRSKFLSLKEKDATTGLEINTDISSWDILDKFNVEGEFGAFSENLSQMRFLILEHEGYPVEKTRIPTLTELQKAFGKLNTEQLQKVLALKKKYLTYHLIIRQINVIRHLRRDYSVRRSDHGVYPILNFGDALKELTDRINKFNASKIFFQLFKYLNSTWDYISKYYQAKEKAVTVYFRLNDEPSYYCRVEKNYTAKDCLPYMKVCDADKLGECLPRGKKVTFNYEIDEITQIRLNKKMSDGKLSEQLKEIEDSTDVSEIKAEKEKLKNQELLKIKTQVTKEFNTALNGTNQADVTKLIEETGNPMPVVYCIKRKNNPCSCCKGKSEESNCKTCKEDNDDIIANAQVKIIVTNGCSKQLTNAGLSRQKINRVESNFSQPLPFNDVFYPRESNYVISKNMLLDVLLKEKNIILATYGYSGMGKSYTLFGAKGVNGMLANTIGSLRNVAKVDVTIFELYGRALPYSDQWYEDNKKNVNCVNQLYTYQIKGDDFEPQNAVSQSLSETGHYDTAFNGYTKYSAEGVKPGQTESQFNLMAKGFAAIVETVEDNRENLDRLKKVGPLTVKPTVNNPKSSRSILFYEFNIIFNIKDPNTQEITQQERTLVIIDLPGKEEVYDSYVKENPRYAYLPIRTVALKHDIASILMESLVINSDATEYINNFTSEHADKKLSTQYNDLNVVYQVEYETDKFLVISPQLQKAVVSACLINPIYLAKILPYSVLQAAAEWAIKDISKDITDETSNKETELIKSILVHREKGGNNKFKGIDRFLGAILYLIVEPKNTEGNIEDGFSSTVSSEFEIADAKLLFIHNMLEKDIPDNLLGTPYIEKEDDDQPKKEMNKNNILEKIKDSKPTIYNILMGIAKGMDLERIERINGKLQLIKHDFANALGSDLEYEGKTWEDVNKYYNQLNIIIKEVSDKINVLMKDNSTRLSKDERSKLLGKNDKFEDVKTSLINIVNELDTKRKGPEGKNDDVEEEILTDLVDYLLISSLGGKDETSVEYTKFIAKMYNNMNKDKSIDLDTNTTNNIFIFEADKKMYSYLHYYEVRKEGDTYKMLPKKGEFIDPQENNDVKQIITQKDVIYDNIQTEITRLGREISTKGEEITSIKETYESEKERLEGEKATEVAKLGIDTQWHKYFNDWSTKSTAEFKKKIEYMRDNKKDTLSDKRKYTADLISTVKARSVQYERAKKIITWITNNYVNSNPDEKTQAAIAEIESQIADLTKTFKRNPIAKKYSDLTNKKKELEENVIPELDKLYVFLGEKYDKDQDVTPADIQRKLKSITPDKIINISVPDLEAINIHFKSLNIANLSHLDGAQVLREGFEAAQDNLKNIILYILHDVQSLHQIKIEVKKQKKSGSTETTPGKKQSKDLSSDYLEKMNLNIKQIFSEDQNKIKKYKSRFSSIIKFFKEEINHEIGKNIENMIYYVVHFAYEAYLINENINGTLWKFIDLAGAGDKYEDKETANYTMQNAIDAVNTIDEDINSINIIKIVDDIVGSYNSGKLFCNTLRTSADIPDNELMIGKIFDYYKGFGENEKEFKYKMLYLAKHGLPFGNKLPSINKNCAGQLNLLSATTNFLKAINGKH